MNKTYQIIALSDLHGELPCNIPEGDLVCICGDILPLSIQHNYTASLCWLINTFKPWAESLICQAVLLIAGNHDFVFQKIEEDMESYAVDYMLFGEESKIYYLRDDIYNFHGLNIYGTPWCPKLQNWAFYADSVDLKKYFSLIPEDTDILLTHCPPKIGTQGVVLQKDAFNRGEDFGCQELTDAIKERPNIKWVLSGHIHSGNHDIDMIGNTKCINVSIKNENYRFVYPIYKFNIMTCENI